MFQELRNVVNGSQGIPRIYGPETLFEWFLPSLRLASGGQSYQDHRFWSSRSQDIGLLAHPKSVTVLLEIETQTMA